MAHAATPRPSEWFWRFLALAMCVALAWLAWVAYQVTPRPLATRAAHEAAARGLVNVREGLIKPAVEAAAPVITLRLTETIGTPPPER